MIAVRHREMQFDPDMISQYAKLVTHKSSTDRRQFLAFLLRNLPAASDTQVAHMKLKVSDIEAAVNMAVKPRNLQVVPRLDTKVAAVAWVSSDNPHRSIRILETARDSDDSASDIESTISFGSTD